MTEKAKAVIQKLRNRQALRNWKRLNNSERRDKIIDQFNRDQLDDVGPVGTAEQGNKVPREMNEL